jgi:hypothetical protein
LSGPKRILLLKSILKPACPKIGLISSWHRKLIGGPSWNPKSTGDFNLPNKLKLAMAVIGLSLRRQRQINMRRFGIGSDITFIRVHPSASLVKLILL